MLVVWMVSRYDFVTVGSRWLFYECLKLIILGINARKHLTDQHK